MKILAVSDFVDKSLKQMVTDKTIELPDLIISCGDLPPEYLEFLRDRLDRPLYYVKGNHDLRYSPTNPLGCENIHTKVKKFQSLNILGLEGSIWYSGGVNQYTDKEMSRIILSKWFSIWRKGGIDMVVSHAPPRHIHDAEDRCHIGFESFVNLINKRKPKYFLHGHIHKEFENFEARATKVNETKVINVCGYAIFEVNKS